MSVREKRIMVAYKNPKTRVAVRFLAYLLRFSDIFERRFQSGEVLVHELFPAMKAMLTEIAVQFMKSDSLRGKEIWNVAFESGTEQLPINEIVIGSDSQTLLAVQKEVDRQCFLIGVNSNT